VRILLVEDDRRTAGFVRKGLKQEGFAVDHAANGEDGLHLALTEPYDASIVDIMLPKLDGLTLIDEMRRRSIRTPVIVLSAKSSVDDRVLLGVCGGIAQALKIDPIIVRILWALFSIGSIGVGVIIYVFLAILMPEDKSTEIQAVEGEILDPVMR
jgi:DNA-binding response OmpR family regulator